VRWAETKKGPQERAFFHGIVSAGGKAPPAFYNGVQSGRMSVPPMPSRKKRVKKVIFLAPISALFRASHFVNEKFTFPQSGILRRKKAAQMCSLAFTFPSITFRNPPCPAFQGGLAAIGLGSRGPKNLGKCRFLGEFLHQTVVFRVPVHYR